MGLAPTRADPDLWIKTTSNGQSYDYIATHVDDLIVVSKNPEQYLDKLKENFPLRHVHENPDFYLGNNMVTRKDSTVKVSLEKYIREVIRKFESDYGELRKENVPHSPSDHPELDDSPKLDDDGRNKYQSVIGICQWISVAGRMDITFAVSSLSRFASSTRENHLKKAIKILGYLKKYPKKGYVIDPKPCNVNIKYDDMVPDFGNQYDESKEEIDENLPEPKMKELEVTIFFDANHGHDQVTGKSVTGVIIFVGRIY